MELPIHIGEPAPDFSLSNADGQVRTLADYAGKWLVLYFYPKDNTSGCTTEALDFTAHLKDFEALNAVVVGVSPDSCASHQKFREKHGLAVELLCDPEKETLQRYGVWQKKRMYGREYMGVVRTTVLIAPDGTIAYIWPKVKVKGHAEAVLTKLKEQQQQ